MVYFLQPAIMNSSTWYIFLTSTTKVNVICIQADKPWTAAQGIYSSVRYNYHTGCYLQALIAAYGWPSSTRYNHHFGCLLPTRYNRHFGCLLPTRYNHHFGCLLPTRYNHHFGCLLPTRYNHHFGCLLSPQIVAYGRLLQPGTAIELDVFCNHI